MKYYITVGDFKYGRIQDSKEILVHENGNLFHPTISSFFGTLRSMGIKKDDELVFDQHVEVKKSLGKKSEAMADVYFLESNVRKTSHGCFGTVTLRIVSDSVFDQALHFKSLHSH
jgi:hypothetical protein